MDTTLSGILTVNEAGHVIALVSILVSLVSVLVRKATVDFEKVKAADKEFQRMRDTAFGTIGSDKFLNCMVEQKV